MSSPSAARRCRRWNVLPAIRNKILYGLHWVLRRTQECDDFQDRAKAVAEAAQRTAATFPPIAAAAGNRSDCRRAERLAEKEKLPCSARVQVTRDPKTH